MFCGAPHSIVSNTCTWIIMSWLLYWLQTHNILVYILVHLLLWPSQNLSSEQSSSERHSTLKHPTAILFGSPRCPAGHEQTATWSKTLQTALGPHWTPALFTQGSVHFPFLHVKVSLQSVSWWHSLGVTQPGSRNGSPTVPKGHTHLYDPGSLTHSALGWQGESLHSLMSRQPDGSDVKPLPHLQENKAN